MIGTAPVLYALPAMACSSTVMPVPECHPRSGAAEKSTEHSLPGHTNWTTGGQSTEMSRRPGHTSQDNQSAKTRQSEVCSCPRASFSMRLSHLQHRLSGGVLPELCWPPPGASRAPPVEGPAQRCAAHSNEHSQPRKSSNAQQRSRKCSTHNWATITPPPFLFDHYCV
jgi:hypothetical protein